MTNAVEVTSQIANRALDMLEGLAQQLGVGVDQLWPVLVRKVQIDWIAGSAVLGILWIVVLLIYRRTPSWRDIGKEWETSSTIPKTFAKVIVVMAMLLLTMFTAAWLNRVSELITPEVKALQFIANKGNIPCVK